MAPVNVFYVDNLREGYAEIAQTTLERGSTVAPRGRETRELRNSTIVLADPTDALPLGVNRRLNTRIAAVEALQLIAGQAAETLVLRSAPKFREYAEDDGSFWGNYGTRMGLQLAAAAERLEADPSSRQAFIALWRAERDLLTDGKRDYPCTVGMSFTVRDGRLEMTTVMRSNDVWLGLAHDVFQFTQLQLTLAACLGVEVGSYTHQPISLHAYAEDAEGIRGLSSVPDRGPVEEVRRGLAAPGVQPVHLLLAARQLLRGEEHEDNLRYLDAGAAAWYRGQLEHLR